MRISDLISNPRLTVESVRSNALANLRPGQTVQARVVSATDDGMARLRIGKAEIAARTPLQFEVGERLTLSVVRTNAPMELKLLQQASPRAIQTHALRNALPRQLPLGRIMGQLGKLAEAHAATPRSGTQPTAAAGNSPVTADNSPAGRLASRAPPLAKTPVPVERPNLTSPSTSTPVTAPAAATTQAPAGKTSLPPVLIQAVQQVLGHHLSGEETITPGRLRRSLEQSGMFLEPRLAQGVDPGRDLKTDLLRLLLQINLALTKAGQQSPQAPSRADAAQQQAPATPVASMLGELRSQAEAGLARVLINQIGALPQSEGTQQVWAFDLPVRQSQTSDNFMLQICRDDAGNGTGSGKADALWSVTLQFDLPGLGPVSSRITLSRGEISSRFAAERADTVARLMRAMPKLDQALSRAGLKIGSLSAGQGSIEAAQAAVERIPRLLDEKA